MATESLVIQINEKGALVVKRNIADIGKAAQGSFDPVQRLKSALAGISVVLLAKQVLGLADTFATLQNKLRVVTEGQEQLTTVTRELFNISQQTRSSFEGAVTMYSRLALASKDLGVSQEQLLQFTESLNQAVVISGATAAEAENAMIQLSQGIASGTLRGDELRSVLEQLPVVADVIAKSLGVTRGQLRQLGFEGKITAQQILIAFQEARGELADRFGKTVPTIGQALTVLRNSLIKISEADLRPLTDAIVDLAETISDPAFQQGFANLVAGLVKIAGLAFEGLSELGNFGKILADTAANATGASTELDRIEQELSAIDRALRNSFLGKPLAFLFTSDEELKSRRDELVKLREELQRAEASRLGVAFTPASGEEKPLAPIPAGTKVDQDALDKQQKLLQGLRDQSAALEYQIRLGDKAEAAISRYNLAIELAAKDATPALVAQATELNEQIIRQNQVLEQSTMVKELREQEEALKVQVAAGEQADQALLRYSNSLAAAKIGGEDFKRTVQELTNSIIAQREALARGEMTRAIEDQIGALRAQLAALQQQGATADAAADALLRYRAATDAAKIGDQQFVAEARRLTEELIAQQHALGDQGIVNSLQEELSLLGLTNRQRAIEVELRKLSASATKEQRDQVAELAGQLYDEQQRLELAGITIEELVRDLARSTRQTLSGVLYDSMTDGIDDIPKRFGDMLKRLAADFAASQLVRMLANFGQGAGFGTAGGKDAGFFKNLAGSIFGGGINTASGPGAGVFAGKFAEGGSFLVPGQGGIDSQLVAMRASPGERVTVEKRGGARERPTVMAPMTFVLPESAMMGGSQLRETESQVGAAAFSALQRAARRSR